MYSKKTVIWDFNGTLLDDTQVCVDCMNLMLEERDLPHLGVQRYRDIFTFPVRDYYIALGFDFKKEPFDIPAHQFIDLYRRHLPRAPLQPGVVEMLRFFRENGMRQVVLSAMEQDFLIETLDVKGILDSFDNVMGITNHLGEGKNDMARQMIAWLGGNPETICMIGDSIHDYEVARELDIDCILVARGHQSMERLEKLDCLVVDNLISLKTRFIP